MQAMALWRLALKGIITQVCVKISNLKYYLKLRWNHQWREKKIFHGQYSSLLIVYSGILNNCGILASNIETLVFSSYVLFLPVKLALSVSPCVSKLPSNSSD